MKTRQLFALFLLLFASLPLQARISTHHQRPATASNPKKKVAMKPNVDIYVYRRCYTPGEKVQMRLSGFNVRVVQFAAYRLDLGTIIPNSKMMEKFGKTLQALNLQGRSPDANWRFPMGKIYPDQWAERAVNVPTLTPGAYLIEARAGGSEKRTWLAVTNVALLAKRSRQEVLVYATQANSGRPIPGLALALSDERGPRAKAATDADGVLRVPTVGARGNLWVCGATGGSPAFALTGEPPVPDPFTVYTVTDRPIYRPGHKVQYKATLRQRFESASPGGFLYRPYAGKPAVVEIRDATDALVARRTVTSNAFGSISGDFQLAGEPALGDWHLNVSVGDFHSYSSFTVDAYRKPEMTANVSFDQPHYLGGATVPVTVEAKYYFGQPVTNASVQYHISFSRDNSEPPYQGQGVTDALGELHLDIKTQRLPSDRELSVRASITDLSRRSQDASGTVLITGGLFQLSVQPDKSVYKPGERVTAIVQATDYDGKPVATKVRVRLIETKEDRQHRAYKETTTRDILTDASGKGLAYFSSPRPDDLQLTAEAFDSESNKITAENSVWVAGDDYADYDYPTLGLVAGRDSYRAGEDATVLLNTSLVGRKFIPATKDAPAQPAHPDAWALVTIEGERMGRSEVVHLTKKTTLLHVPLTDNDFPSVSVNVAVIQDHQLYEQEQRLSVTRQQQKLSVAVTSDKAKYLPGETATYTVTTRDFRGRPVPAEVSLGVVDAAIYAIQTDNAPDMEQTFYGEQTVRIQTDFSFAAQYSGGGYQSVPSPAPGVDGGIRVRRLFADTAYWNPFVDTGADGTARVSFTVPDNLTTWRATAHGITTQTAVGSATEEAIATMPLLVRLELPRFYVQGDESVVSAIVQNYTGTARTVQAHIEAHGATLTGDAQRTLQLPANGSARVDWRAKIDTPTPDSPPRPNNGGPDGTATSSQAHPLLGAGGAALVHFLVVADGGPGGQDATEQTLPVYPNGLKMVTASADTLSDTTAQDKIAIGDLPPGATVTLNLSPSLASATFDALNWLTAYPYGCAEQTMSAFLPDIAVAHALHRLHSGRTVRPDLDQWVSLGLQKLYRYQHPDGGWNWWEFDQTDGDMTAYVLSGLVQARDAGYVVDDQRILRGKEALLRLLGQEQELGHRADWLLTIAQASPADAEKPLGAMYAKREHLDTYGEASLCLALAQLGGPKPTVMARMVAQDLAAKAAVHGRTAYWSATEGGYSWRNDDVDVTAHALRALLTALPSSALNPAAVRWLMSNRDGQAWGTTKASAEAVMALTQYMEQTGELQPSFTAHVSLDGQSIKDITATPQTVFGAPTTVTLTPDELKGHTSLTVDKLGDGVLYVAQVNAFLIAPEQATAQSHGITVHRLFKVSTDDPAHADTIASGSEMDVQLEIQADADYRYAMLEDPIPAGCEVQSGAGDDGNFPIDYSEGTVGYTRQETRDNRVVFFFDTLPKGMTRLTYRLQAETPGQFRILPGIASLTYFPEVRGNSGLATSKIGERP